MKNEKQSKALKIIAVILYIAAAVFMVIGIVVAIRTMLGGEFHFSLKIPDRIDPDDDLFENKPKISDFGFMYFEIALFIAIVATVFLVISKKIKSSATVTKVFSDSDYNLYTEGSDKPSQTPVEDTAPVEEKVEEKKRIFCAYCGSELEESDKRCPNCGSSKKVKR